MNLVIQSGPQVVVVRCDRRLMARAIVHLAIWSIQRCRPRKGVILSTKLSFDARSVRIGVTWASRGIPSMEVRALTDEINKRRGENAGRWVSPNEVDARFMLVQGVAALHGSGLHVCEQGHDGVRVSFELPVVSCRGIGQFANYSEAGLCLAASAC